METIRLIIADDHEMFRQGLRSMIESRDDMTVVAEAEDGKTLMKAIEDHPCDVVISDVAMPQMDGLTALKLIHDKYPDIRILILTMLKDHEHFRHAMSSGASGYLLKEDAFDQLAVAIQRITRGKTFVSASVASLLADRFIRSMDEIDAPSLNILTKREQEVLKSIAQGETNKAIAYNLGISVRTVETHRIHVTSKLGIKNTAGLVKYALTKGLI